MRPSALLVFLGLVPVAACGDDRLPAEPAPDAGDACEHAPYAHGTDGLYAGYVECSPARFPDFTHPTTRWDGSYPDGCVGTSGLDAFACFEQLFWQVLQFDDAGRADAYLALEALALEAGEDPTLDAEQRARLFWRLGQLGSAMAAEDGDLSAAPDIQRYIERAVEILPDSVMLQGWLKTVEIMVAVQLGTDYEPILDELWALYPQDPASVAGAVLGIAAGLPLDTGWPDTAVEIVANMDHDACEPWCGWEFLRAPYAMIGQYFLYAETYARVGDVEGARHWLEQAAAQPDADTWPFAPELDAALADTDAFAARFTDRPADETVFDLMVMNTEGTCRGCHDHQR